MDVFRAPRLPGGAQPLNVTLRRVACGTLNFGFIGCRDTLPHLQRLAVYTGEALDQLAAADGAAGPVPEFRITARIVTVVLGWLLRS